MEPLYDAIVVGGGAAGLTAAVCLAREAGRRRKTAAILLVEKGPRVGKKLLATGNGTCNLSNLGAQESRYHGADPAFVRPALAACTPADAMAFFASIGVECAAREDGKVYPLPAQAAAVLDCLRLEAAALGVEERCGAAVRDILNILGRRYPMARVIFAPVLVQGEGAAPSLVDALRRFNEADAADVLIIGRGGGSIEELWAFNEEAVAQAVAASRIPVISAVGHETDFTICDFAADLRAPTPSAAAELAVPDQQQLIRRVAQLEQNARRAVAAGVQDAAKRLEAVRAKRCLSTPLFYVEEQAMRLDYITKAFVSAAQMQTARADRRLAAAASKLDALSPLKVLSRGYAIGYGADGRVVKSTADVAPGDSLDWRLSGGSIRCTVDEVRAQGEDT